MTFDEQIQRNIGNGVSTAIIDPNGVAEASLIAALKHRDNAFLVENAKLTKDILLQILKSQHEKGILELPNGKHASWNDARKAIGPHASLPALIDNAVVGLKSSGSLLVLIRLTLSESKQPLLARLAKSVCVIVTVADARLLPPEFHIMATPDPTAEQTQEYIWARLDRRKVEHPGYLEKRLLFLAGEDRLQLDTLVLALARKDFISIGDIRQLEPVEPMPKTDITPVLLIMAALLLLVKVGGMVSDRTELWLVAYLGIGTLTIFYRVLNRGKLDE